MLSFPCFSLCTALIWGSPQPLSCTAVDFFQFGQKLLENKQERGFHMNRKAALIYKSASLGSLDKKLIFTCRKRKASQTTRRSVWSATEGKVCLAWSCLVLVQVAWPPEPEQITFTCTVRKGGETRKSPCFNCTRRGLFQAHTHCSVLSQVGSTWRKHDSVSEVSSIHHYTTACWNRDRERFLMQYVRRRKRLPEPFPYYKCKLVDFISV